METTTYFCRKRRFMKKIIFGILLIAAGILLLLFNTGYLPIEYRHIVFSWPVLLIAFGLINIFNKDSWVVGIVLLAVGGFFLAHHLLFFPQDFHLVFWPALLILFGLLSIVKRGFSHHWHDHHPHRQHDFRLDSGYIEEKNVFGGSKQKITPCEFKGGRIQNVFGGTELDLTQTTLAEGKNVLEIKCVFGGVSIIVPSDWVIHVEMTSVMGAFVDKRSGVPTAPCTRELYIKGEAVFGGGEIKSY